MKKEIGLITGLVTIGSILAGNAMAEPLSLGVGLLVAPNPYRVDQRTVYPIPIVNYENEQFYIKGDLGYYLWNDGSNKLAATLSYSPLHFDPSDGHNSAMKQLDKRHSSLFTGLGYQYKADWGIVRANLSIDALNNSNGIIGDLSYTRRFPMGDFWLAPGIGMRWDDERFNRYYYGVSSAESARSGLARYRPGSSWAPYAQLAFGYSITPRLSSYVYSRYTRLSSEAADSPMVNQKYFTSMVAGISYTF